MIFLHSQGMKLCEVVHHFQYSRYESQNPVQLQGFKEETEIATLQCSIIQHLKNKFRHKILDVKILGISFLDTFCLISKLKQNDSFTAPSGF